MTYGEYHGKICYEAYCRQAQEDDEEGLAGHALKWEELDESTRECWIKAADSVANEFRRIGA